MHVDIEGEDFNKNNNIKCVKHPYHGKKFMQEVIEEYVQATSEVQTIGCLIYSRALLCAYKDNPKSISKRFFQQGFVQAAMRAATDTSEKVEYCRNDCPDVTRYLQEAQALIHKEKGDLKKMLDDNTIDELNDAERTFIEKQTQQHHIDLTTKYKSRKSPRFTVLNLRNLFSTTLNRLSRVFITQMMNNMWMHMEKRQKGAISNAVLEIYPKENGYDNSYRSFVTKYVIWKISGASDESRMKPNPNMYKAKSKLIHLKLDESIPTEIAMLINDHVSVLGSHDMPTHKDFGVLTKGNILKYPERFWPYMVKLNETYGRSTLINPTDVKEVRRFQLIPQYTMKVRFVTIGKSELASILKHVSKNHIYFPEFPAFLRNVAPLDTFTGSQGKLDSKISQRKIEIRNYTDSIEKFDEKLDNPNISTADQKKLKEMKVKKKLNYRSQCHIYLIERENGQE